jgi:hypothetical protein
LKKIITSVPASPCTRNGVWHLSRMASYPDLVNGP